jgi:hypothetical protein
LGALFGDPAEIDGQPWSQPTPSSDRGRARREDSTREEAMEGGRHGQPRRHERDARREHQSPSNVALAPTIRPEPALGRVMCTRSLTNETLGARLTDDEDLGVG